MWVCFVAVVVLHRFLFDLDLLVNCICFCLGFVVACVCACCSCVLQCCVGVLVSCVLRCAADLICFDLTDFVGLIEWVCLIVLIAGFGCDFV